MEKVERQSEKERNVSMTIESQSQRCRKKIIKMNDQQLGSATEAITLIQMSKKEKLI